MTGKSCIIDLGSVYGSLLKSEVQIARSSSFLPGTLCVMEFTATLVRFSFEGKIHM
jgi:hypothetical protein